MAELESNIITNGDEKEVVVVVTSSALNDANEEEASPSDTENKIPKMETQSTADKPTAILSSSSGMIKAPPPATARHKDDASNSNNNNNMYFNDSKPPPVLETTNSEVTSLSASEAFYSSGDDLEEVLSRSDATLGLRRNSSSENDDDDNEIQPLQHRSSSLRRHSKTPFGLVSSIVADGMQQKPPDGNSTEEDMQRTVVATNLLVIASKDSDKDLESSQDRHYDGIDVGNNNNSNDIMDSNNDNNDQAPSKEGDDDPVETATSFAESEEAVRELKLKQKQMLFEEQKGKKKAGKEESHGELRRLDDFVLAKQMVAETSATTTKKKKHLGGGRRVSFSLGGNDDDDDDDDDDHGGNQALRRATSSSSAYQPGAVRVSRIGRREWSDRHGASANNNSTTAPPNDEAGGNNHTPAPDLMVEATLVSGDYGMPPEFLDHESQDFSRRGSVASNDLVYAEKLQKSWFTDKRVQCGIVTVLLLAIGITLWAVLTAPGRREQEFGVFSSSPSVSLVPSVAPSTAAPSVSPSQAPTGRQTGLLTLEIQFDDYPHETSWQLSGPCGVVWEGRPGEYNAQYKNEFLTTQMDVFVDIPYIFTFIDSYGDGFCCPGGSAVLSFNGTVLFKVVDDFGSSSSTRVRLPGVRGGAITCTPTSVPTTEGSASPSTSLAPSRSFKPTSTPTGMLDLFKSFETKGLCIEIPNSEVRDGVTLRLANCTYAPNQLWSLVNNRIRSALDPTMCIDSEDTDHEPRMQLFRCQSGYAPQSFVFSQEPHPNVILNSREFFSACGLANFTSLDIIMDRCGTSGTPTSWDRRNGLEGNLPSEPTSSPTTVREGFFLLGVNGLCATTAVTFPQSFDRVVPRPCGRTDDFLWQTNGFGRVYSIADEQQLCWRTSNGDHPLVIDYCDEFFERFLFDGNGRIHLDADPSRCLAPIISETEPDVFETIIFAVACNETSPSQIFTQTLWGDLPPAPTAAPSVSEAPTSFGTFVVELTIFFDFYPTQVGWMLSGPCGVVAEATPGHYDNYFRRQQHVEAMEVQAGHSYTFTILDVNGQGLCCPSGRVSLALNRLDGTKEYLLRAADNFGSSLSTNFTVAGNANTIDCAASNP